MAFHGEKASLGKFCFLVGLGLACLALFLHPMDPAAFLSEVFFTPENTFRMTHGYLQTIGFWISVGFMGVGIVGMLGTAVQRWRARHFLSRLRDAHSDSVDGEENWMFL